MRLAVVSPFLDHQHGTGLCIIEQIERLASQHNWEIHLYSQRVQDVRGLRPAPERADNSPGFIFWHWISAFPGPHLLRYLWWFAANQLRRKWDQSSGKLRPDLIYSPGINCLDADGIVVHIVFHEFYRRVKSELALRTLPLRSWPRLIHRKLYYKLLMALERRVGAVSENSITRQQAGLVRRGQKRAVGAPLISLGPALMGNSLCPGQEKRTMCELEVQIGNSGQRVSTTLRGLSHRSRC